jgi:hypothetical protein
LSLGNDKSFWLLSLFWVRFLPPVTLLHALFLAGFLSSLLPPVCALSLSDSSCSELETSETICLEPHGGATFPIPPGSGFFFKVAGVSGILSLALAAAAAGLICWLAPEGLA